MSESSLVECSCVICDLLKCRFYQRSIDEKRRIIANGRPTPGLYLDDVVVEKATKRKYTRHFKPCSYEKYDWLTGCKTVGRLFCWSCLLFNIDDPNVWNASGFWDISNFHKNVQRHIMNKGHLAAIIKEKTFGLANINNLDNQLDNTIKLHNELVEKNRDTLKRLIDITCFLTEHELKFKDDCSEGSEHVTSYIDLVLLLKKYDEAFRSNLKRLHFFETNITEIQGNLLKSIANVVLARFKQEIKRALYITLTLNEYVDKNNLSRIAVVVRFVNSDGSPQERFLGFIDFITDRTIEPIFELICDIVEDLDCGSKLIAQSYDGAVVTTNDFKTLQVKVKKHFGNAIFVHNIGHDLNQVLSQALGIIKECKMFFSTLDGMADFFRKSPKRSQALNSHAEIYFRATPIHWNNEQLVQLVSQNREILVEFLRDIWHRKELWDADTVNASRGYLYWLQYDFNFNFLLNLFSDVFSRMSIFYDTLQNKINDIDFCAFKISDAKNYLTQQREQFQNVWQKTLDMNLEQQVKRAKPDNTDRMKPSYHRLYLKIFNIITQQFKGRFQHFEDFRFVELCKFDKSMKARFPQDALKSLKLSYSPFFDTACLTSELQVIYKTPETNSQKTPLGLLKFFKRLGLETSYKEVVKLCTLVLTMPLGKASVLSRIESFIRNMPDEEKIASLAVLFVEKDCVKGLCESATFYDDVMQEFAKNDETLELQYK